MLYKLRYILAILIISILITIGINIADSNMKPVFAPSPLPLQHTPINNKKLISVEATAYTLAEGNGDGYTATMTIPLQGRTIAVDPSIIKYGTKLTINGIPGFIAEDCGGAIKGYKIDIFMNSYDEAINFGRQNVIVEID